MSAFDLHANVLATALSTQHIGVQVQSHHQQQPACRSERGRVLAAGWWLATAFRLPYCGSAFWHVSEAQDAFKAGYLQVVWLQQCVPFSNGLGCSVASHQVCLASSFLIWVWHVSLSALFSPKGIFQDIHTSGPPVKGGLCDVHSVHALSIGLILLMTVMHADLCRASARCLGRTCLWVWVSIALC